MKKVLSIIIIFLILITSTINNPREIYAVEPVSTTMAISYLVVAAIAAGAVGTVYYDADIGDYTGDLWEMGKSALNGMTELTQNNLKLALGASKVLGYMAYDKVTGLYDYLKNFFVNSSESLVPVYSTFNPDEFFDTTVKVIRGSSIQISNIATYKYTTVNGKIILNPHTGNEFSDYNLNLNTSDKVKEDLYHWVQSIADNPKIGVHQGWSLIYDSSFSATGTWPTDSTNVSLRNTDVNTGTPQRKLAIPADPTLLSNITSTDSFPTTGGYDSTSEVDDEIADTIDSGTKPETKDDWIGTIGAAVAGILTAISGIPQAIHDTFLGDGTYTIDWTPLQISGTLFTTKFPFSIPWDIKRLFTSFSSTQLPAPVINVDIPTKQAHFKFDLDLSLFNPFMPMVRSFELILFGLGLALSTRKLLGSAS